MRVSVLINAPFEGLGIIRDWLGQKKFTIHEIHTYQNDPLPSWHGFDWLIIMGGPQDLKQIRSYPYLAKIVKWLSQAHLQKKGMLGICLGAQLIAESLGTKTEASPEKEIGVFPVQLTEAGFTDPITRYFPDRFNATHWHNDMPGLPRGATILAKSAACPRQIIRFSPQVYGLQCHLELTLKEIQQMLAHEEHSTWTSGRFIQTKEELLSQSYRLINQQMILFLDHFCNLMRGVASCEKISF
jgi:GMP synthase (glutamine-hydrolysing)